MVSNFIMFRKIKLCYESGEIVLKPVIYIENLRSLYSHFLQKPINPERHKKRKWNLLSKTENVFVSILCFGTF